MENFDWNTLENTSGNQPAPSQPGTAPCTPDPTYAATPNPYIPTANAAPRRNQFDSFSFPVEEPKKKKSGCNIWLRLISAVLVFALVIVSCGITAVCVNSRWQKALDAQAAQQKQEMDELRRRINAQTTPTITVQPGATTAEGELTPTQVYAMNVDAVVAISNQGLTTNIFGQVSQTASSGSGFIVSENGYVVTNYHVVKGATTLTVITSDGTEHNAQVAGYDASNDLAVLKIEGTQFPYTTMGSSDALVVGSMVAAIGNPLGELTSTYTVGYVSAMDRMVNTDGTSMSMIQTDAAINSGNSGGPLFNMRGEVIGITTAKYSGTSNSGATIEGIGFAIPIDDVRSMIDDIVEFGYVKSGYLGVVVQDVPASDAKKYGLPTGALVLEVSADSCAEKAGIQANDIITAVGDNAVGSLNDLSAVLREYEPGQEAEITVYRNGSYMKLAVVFDEKPQTTTTETPAQTETQPTTPENSFGFGNAWPFSP